jgi:hypothetical protein
MFTTPLASVQLALTLIGRTRDDHIDPRQTTTRILLLAVRRVGSQPPADQGGPCFLGGFGKLEQSQVRGRDHALLGQGVEERSGAG